MGSKLLQALRDNITFHSKQWAVPVFTHETSDGKLSKHYDT